MYKFSMFARALISLGVLITMSSVAMAKGNESSPVVVVIDESGNTVKVDTPLEEPILISIGETLLSPATNRFIIVEDAGLICVGSESCTSSPLAPYVVPEGKVLVIETVTALGTNEGASWMFAEFRLTLESQTFQFLLGLTDGIDPDQLQWAKTFPVLIRARAGSKLGAALIWDTEGAYGGGVTISGRLVDAP